MNALMGKVFILFPSAHIIVGAGLFLIFFLRQLWLQAFPPFCFPD